MPKPLSLSVRFIGDDDLLEPPGYYRIAAPVAFYIFNELIR